MFTQIWYDNIFTLGRDWKNNDSAAFSDSSPAHVVAIWGNLTASKGMNVSLHGLRKAVYIEQ